MKVYTFNLVVQYGAGIRLVAANNRQEARAVSNSVPQYGGVWEIVGLFKGLTYKTDTPQIIKEVYHIE